MSGGESRRFLLPRGGHAKHFCLQQTPEDFQVQKLVSKTGVKALDEGVRRISHRTGLVNGNRSLPETIARSTDSKPTAGNEIGVARPLPLDGYGTSLIEDEVITHKLPGPGANLNSARLSV
jgi:hypothetical protein